MTPLSRRRVLASLGTAAFGGTAAGKRPSESRAQTGSAQPERFELYGAFLTGANQVPPVKTSAAGAALFRLDARRRLVDYWLFVADIANVREAHIHKGPPDLNGNVVAYLFGPVEDPVSTTGLLRSGTLRAEDLIWPLTDIASLREQMEAANVYVNVHTTAHPSGEIRGQIRALAGAEAARPKSLYGADAQGTM